MEERRIRERERKGDRVKVRLRKERRSESV